MKYWTLEAFLSKPSDLPHGVLWTALGVASHLTSHESADLQNQSSLHEKDWSFRKIIGGNSSSKLPILSAQKGPVF